MKRSRSAAPPNASEHETTATTTASEAATIARHFLLRLSPSPASPNPHRTHQASEASNRALAG